MNPNQTNPTFSNSQNLENVNPTPSISTRDFEILPNSKSTLKIVGTSLYVASCFSPQKDNTRKPAAMNIQLGFSEPFLAEEGTKVEFKYYGTPFNQIILENKSDEKIIARVQIGYMVEVGSGDASGTAGYLAVLQDAVNLLKQELEKEIATRIEIDETKQNKLTFDPTPRNGSNNPVTSGGIYQAILNKLSIEQWNSGGASFWSPKIAGTLDMKGDKRILNLKSLVFKNGTDAFTTDFQKNKSGTLAFLEDFAPLISRIEALESQMNIEPIVASYEINGDAQTVDAHLAGEELNGTLDVSSNQPWLSANQDGEIAVQENPS